MKCIIRRLCHVGLGLPRCIWPRKSMVYGGQENAHLIERCKYKTNVKGGRLMRRSSPATMHENFVGTQREVVPRSHLNDRHHTQLVRMYWAKLPNRKHPSKPLVRLLLDWCEKFAWMSFVSYSARHIYPVARCLWCERGLGEDWKIASLTKKRLRAAGDFPEIMRMKRLVIGFEN